MDPAQAAAQVIARRLILQLTPQQAPKEAIELMNRCLSYEAVDRPTFAQICQWLPKWKD
jgi:hypothetical protein